MRHNESDNNLLWNPLRQFPQRLKKHQVFVNLTTLLFFSLDDDIDVTSVTMAAKAMLDLLDEISLSEGLVSDTSKRNFRRQPMSYVDSERSLTLASQDSKVLQTQARVPSEKECPTTLNSRLAERTDRHSGGRTSDETKVGQNSMVSEVGTMFYQQPEMSFSTNTSKNSSRQHHPPNVSSNR